MSSYLTAEQYQILMHPAGISEKRVQSRDGMAYVEVHDIKAMMIRVYGFDRFSWVIRESVCLFEREVKTSAGKDAFNVGYRVSGVLSVFAPDGTHLADYSGTHAGGSTHPQLIEAHGNALTNADSYAFKRAALFPLGTQGGLGLYNKGSKSEIVRWTVNHPELPEQDEKPAADPADVPAVAAESLTADPADDPRTTTAPTTSAPERAIEIRDELIRGPHKAADKANPRAWLSGLMREATAAHVLAARVPDADGLDVALKLLLERGLKAVAA